MSGGTHGCAKVAFSTSKTKPWRRKTQEGNELTDG